MFWLGPGPGLCETAGVRLYTRYRPARARHRPWRLWLALALLGVGLYGWLRWQPREREQPQELLLRAAESREPAKPVPAPAAVSSEAQRTDRGSTGEPTASAAAPEVGAAVRPPPDRGTNAVSAPAEGLPVENLFEAQLALARMGLSPGSLDGVMGSRTRNALREFQRREKLRVSGELDAATRKRLRLVEQPYTNYTVTVADLGRLMPVGAGWVAKSEQPRLDYENVLELVSERSWSHPDFVRRMNPSVAWDQVEAGVKLLVPNVFEPVLKGRAALIRIQLANRFLQVFDDRVNLIAHYPCTIAGSVDRRPLGELRVEVLIPQPNYTFDPAR
ncbi:MAG: peptidoglycan-binding protein, partial [Verrucomicrobia bacterium]|nr:peptidoglycan-binding protein [Verrucomicrobiota bacterium]